MSTDGLHLHVFTLGGFREKVKDLPDDTILVGEFEQELMFNELAEIRILPSVDVLNLTPVVILYGGQIINHEYDLDARFDAQLGM